MRRKMCIYKCMLNVYTNQQNRQAGSRNLMGPKMLPMIWSTYMKLVTKYQISAINSYWEKCDEKYLGRMEGRKDKRTDRRTEVKQYTPPPSGSGGIKIISIMKRKSKQRWSTIPPISTKQPIICHLNSLNTKRGNSIGHSVPIVQHCHGKVL
jgi:hypothetical protein